jgi:MSHA biogenesis protein MshP
VRSTIAPQHGFAAIAAIFLVVVLAALGGFMVTFSNTQQLTSAQDLQGTRAYWAARAGLEWGIGSVVASTTAGTTTPVCPTSPTSSTTTIGTNFDGGFTVVVKCRHDDYTEGSASANRFIFQFTSESTSGGSVGSVGYIQRSVSASMECQGNATAPLFTCG